ncbi:MAG: HAD family hydrolase [Myxococcales bacterium]|nr:HAD family hydrolase [Myxococcales bacterium]
MRPPPLPTQIDVLNRVLEVVSAARRHREPPPLVVFDLDGTLLDTRPRTLRILQDYASDIAEEFPEIANALGGITLDALRYLLSDTLRDHGISQPDQIRDVTHYWRDRFFSDDYLVCDEPLEGAVDYVGLLHETGASIMYLTGRDSLSMLVGTVTSLSNRGFPFGSPGIELVLKPDSTLADEAFKRSTLPTLNAVGNVVAYFDNEPANCNMASAFFPDAIVVHVESQQVPGAPLADEGVESIIDFRTFA